MPEFCYPDGGYSADKKNVFRMGPVFIAFSVGRKLPLLPSSILIGQQQIATNEARGKESGRNRFHPIIRHPDNKIPGLYLVAAVNLGVGLLHQGHPELVGVEAAGVAVRPPLLGQP